MLFSDDIESYDNEEELEMLLERFLLISDVLKPLVLGLIASHSVMLYLKRKREQSRKVEQTGIVRG